MIICSENPNAWQCGCFNAIRDLTGMGLAAAKEFSKLAGTPEAKIKEFSDKESLLEAKRIFDELGTTTRIGN